MNPKLNTDWFSKNADENNLAVTKQITEEVLKTGLSLVGSVHSLGEVIERDTGFSKRELVLLTDDYRPNLICFEFHNAKMKELNELVVNEKVEISFLIKGRQWNDRVLNNLVGKKVKRLNTQKIDLD